MKILGNTVLFAVASLVVIFGFGAWMAFHYSEVKARVDKRDEFQRCVNQMHSLGIGGQLWAADHEGKFPSNWQCLSNEVSDLRIVVCPGDHARRFAANWSALTDADSSYQIVSPGVVESETNVVFLRCLIHGFVG